MKLSVLTSGKGGGFCLTFPQTIFSLTFLLMVDDDPVMAIKKKACRKA
jgi:hypothetical protein